MADPTALPTAVAAAQAVAADRHARGADQPRPGRRPPRAGAEVERRLPRRSTPRSPTSATGTAGPVPPAPARRRTTRVRPGSVTVRATATRTTTRTASSSSSTRPTSWSAATTTRRPDHGAERELGRAAGPAARPAARPPAPTEQPRTIAVGSRPRWGVEVARVDGGRGVPIDVGRRARRAHRGAGVRAARRLPCRTRCSSWARSSTRPGCRCTTCPASAVPLLAEVTTTVTTTNGQLVRVDTITTQRGGGLRRTSRR